MLDPAFWPTVALALPVLALTIVIEARITISRWTDNDPPRPFRAAQSLLWLVPLMLFIYLEIVSFQALEGSEVPHVAVALVTPTVGLSLFVIVASPGVELLIRSNARVVARILVAFPVAKIRWNARRNVRELRKFIQERKVEQSNYLEWLTTLRSIENLFKSQQQPVNATITEGLESILESRRYAIARRAQLAEQIEKAQDLLDQAVRFRENSKHRTIKPEIISEMEAAVSQMKFRIRRSRDHNGSEESAAGTH